MNEGYFRYVAERPDIARRDVRIIRAQAPEALDIVDLGCGRGDFLSVGGRVFDRVIGLDNHPTSARICQSKGLPCLLGDVDALPFRAASLDVVRAKDIIEHLTDARPMLREIHRVLKPDGLLLVYAPSQFCPLYPVANFWDDYTHVRPLSRLGLRRLLEDTGFEITFIAGYTAGRNIVERFLARVMSLVVPYWWLSAARRPSGNAGSSVSEGPSPTGRAERPIATTENTDVARVVQKIPDKPGYSPEER